MVALSFLVAKAEQKPITIAIEGNSFEEGARGSLGSSLVPWTEAGACCLDSIKLLSVYNRRMLALVKLLAIADETEIEGVLQHMVDGTARHHHSPFGLTVFGLPKL